MDPGVVSLCEINVKMRRRPRDSQTKLNLADIFTKGVPKEVLNKLARYLLGQMDVQELIREMELATHGSDGSGSDALKGIKDAGGESHAEAPRDP